jgi:hypothetical protein
MKKAITVSLLVLTFTLFAMACEKVIFCGIDGAPMFPTTCETNPSQHTITCRYEHTADENGRSVVHYKYVQCDGK